MTSHEPCARTRPWEAQPASDWPTRTAAPTGPEVGACDDTTSTNHSSAEPWTVWSELGFDQALAARCALYGWTAHRVSEYLCREHGNADPFDTILNGCDPLEALTEHETGGSNG